MQERYLATRQTLQDEAEAVTSVRDIAMALFRQRRKFLVVAFSTFALACLWTFGTGKKYTSEMVLLVQSARSNDVVTSGTSAISATTDVTEEQLNSEIAVLDSADLLDEVIDKNWARQNETTRSHSDLLRHERAVADLRSRLDVSAIRSSHAIIVKLTSRDSQEGRDTLAKLLNAFMVKQTELGRPPGTSKFYNDRAAEYERQIADARSEFARYQNEHGFVSLDAHEATISQKLADLNNQIRENEVQISDARRRADADVNALRDTERRVTTLERTAAASGAIDQLNTLLVSLTNKRTELLTVYQPEDRLVKQIDQQIADTKAGIKNATSMNPNEVSSDVNPLWLASKSDLNANRIRLEGLTAVHGELLTQISSLRNQLNTVESLSPEFNALQQKVSELETGYQLVLQKRDASIMADMMDRQQWLNLAVIESPTLPLFPSHPKPATDLALGAVTALLLGAVAIFLFESARHTIATPAELESISRFPVLAVVPLHITAAAERYDQHGYLISPSDAGRSV